MGSLQPAVGRRVGKFRSQHHQPDGDDDDDDDGKYVEEETQLEMSDEERPRLGGKSTHISPRRYIIIQILIDNFAENCQPRRSSS